MIRHSALQSFMSIILLALLLASSSLAARKTNPAKVPRNAALLSDISTLTLRSGKQTAHRRVSSVPQIKCIGPKDVCALYNVDVMRCNNAGSDYDPDNVQWTCTASLPAEFKLGTTDVTCEGYESNEDPYVLKGSCGVEYRQLLTEKGEEKYGRRGSSWRDSLPSQTNMVDLLSKSVFWVIFSLVAIVILRSMFGGRNTPGRRTAGGGGFGWGGGGPDDDPPPPYEPPRKPRPRPSYSSNRRGEGRGQRWEPGFWSGALGGAAAGYTAGNWARRQTPARDSSSQSRSWFGGGGNDPGEGSSRSPPSFSSTRHESSGFGSSNRR